MGHFDDENNFKAIQRWFSADTTVFRIFFYLFLDIHIWYRRRHAVRK